MRRTGADYGWRAVSLAKAGRANYFTSGGSVDASHVHFGSDSTLGILGSNFFVDPSPDVPGSGTILHPLGNLGYAPLALQVRNIYYGHFALNAFDITPRLVATVGARFNAADIMTFDCTGTAPEDKQDVRREGTEKSSYPLRFASSRDMNRRPRLLRCTESQP